MAAQKDQSLIHREMKRRSQDTHRVKNIRDEDFELVWDSYVDIVPANGTADLSTFKTDKYLKEMANLILGKRQKKEIEKENKRRKELGQKEMEKWTGEAQHNLESKFALEKGISNPEERMKIYRKLYVGLVKEYGVDKLSKKESVAKPDTHEDMMTELLGKRAPVEEPKAPIEQKTTDGTTKTPLEEMNQPQLRKVAKEMGIETSKTDKKQVLMDRISQNEN